MLIIQEAGVMLRFNDLSICCRNQLFFNLVVKKKSHLAAIIKMIFKAIRITKKR